jgi:REP element-mobilizing transposase RayT
MTLPVMKKNNSTLKRQQTFASSSGEFKDYWLATGRKVHGGDYANGLRKTKRPFSSKKPMHLVLKSLKAKGSLSMWARSNSNYIYKLIYKHAEACEVKLYKYSNNGNHLHLAIRAKDHKLFKKFLRTIAGLIARHVLKAEKGRAKGKFWDALAFTRIAEWGKSFQTLKRYILQNVLEAAGVIPYQSRKRQKFRAPPHL